MNTIYTLWLRQLKKYFRSRSRLIGSLGQPILYLISFSFGFGSIYQRAGNGNYLQFLAPGIILMSVLFTSVFSGIDLIWDRQFGFLKETLVAPVSRFEIMVGKVAGGASVATIQGIIVFILTILLGFRPTNFALLPLALFLVFLVALLFTALGTAIASSLQDIQGFQLIVNFLVMPIFFLSGSLFPTQGLPSIIHLLSIIDPLSFGIDALRGVLINSPTNGLGVDLFILLAITASLIALGSYLFEKIQV